MSKYHFEKLTPFNDVDINIYEEAIDYAINENEIKNVAISGSYGAGKSSLLETYRKKHDTIKFLFISLAHFQSSYEKNNEEDSVKESVLEGKLLNQLIHQIPVQNIQQTNFKVKKDINKKEVKIQAGLITLFLVLVFYMIFFENWKNLIENMNKGKMRNILYGTLNSNFKLVLGVGFIIMLFFLLKSVITIQKNKNIIRKLNIQGNEIEIFEESNDSYFDKYLNEVIYLFENADADIIVFEDMDRFNVNNIFERLREINTLINRSYEKNKKKKIMKFFYLLKDDVFISKDRTKFFDFIIPVIPVIDSSNSYDMLIKQLNNNNLFNKFDEHFLQNISLYIDDMRVLKNICNEFLIYYHRLSKIEIQCNKMLAIIIYKNLFPRDFSLLQLNQGFVYSLFSQKNKFIEIEKTSLQFEIDKKKEELKKIEEENLETLHELDIILNYKESGLKNIPYYEEQIAKNEFQKWKEIEYVQRKNAIKKRNENKVNVIYQELDELENKLLRINEYKLYEIITRDNIDNIFGITLKNEIGKVDEFKEVKGNIYFNLLKYVIREGYIDETYPDYMTYFYEAGLSRVDKLFLQSVADKKAKEYSYTLKEPDKVFSRLRVRDFEEEETMNYSLLDFVLDKHIHSVQLDHFITSQKKAKNCDFILKYIESTEQLPKLINILNKKWNNFFNDLLSSNINKSKIKKYSILTLYYSNDDDILNVDVDRCLTDYISNNEDYLNIENPDSAKLIHGFELLGVYFQRIDYKLSNKELFDLVYTRKLFSLNYENIKMILMNVYNISSKEDIVHKNYSVICRFNDSPLYDKVINNIDEYLSIILDHCDEEILDDESLAIRILNMEQIHLKHRKKYIDYYNNMIYRRIIDVTARRLWSNLLEKRIIECSENNIMDYFLENGMDMNLVNFINATSKKLDFNDMGRDYDNNHINHFFNLITETNEINDIKYKQIILSLNLKQNSFNISNIEANKFNILVDNDIIKMNQENLVFIRSNYSDFVLKFIKKNINEYKENMSNEIFLEKELIEILSWNVSDEIKLHLLKYTNNPISILNKNYSVKIRKYILENNLFDEDLYILFKNYDNLENDIQSIVLENALIHINDIVIKNIQTISYQLKLKLFSSTRLSDENKYNLLVNTLPTIDKEKATEIFNILGLNDYMKLLKNNEITNFKINSQNRELLDIFVSKEWIYDYKEDLDNDSYVIVLSTLLKKD